jgi:autotransporter-associated beta strand protein
MKESNWRILWLVACAVVSAAAVWANECTWNPPDGVTWRWTNQVCWAEGTLPAAGDTVILPAGKGGTINMDGASFSLAKIQLPGYAAGYAYRLEATGATGTCELTGGAEVSVGLNAYLALGVTVGGGAGLAKTGEGTLELGRANTFTGPLSVSAGRVIADMDAALGEVPEVLDPSAIVLTGGELGNLAGDLALAGTRGITLVGEGQLFGRNNKGVIVNAPITGEGDLVIVEQTGYVRLASANTYTGKTRVGDTGYFPYAGGAGRLYLDAAGALPAATELVSASAGAGAEIHLGTNSQSVAALTVNGALWVYDAATLSYSGAGNSFTNVYLGAGTRLAYTGTGTVTPGFKAASSGTFEVLSGTLSVTSVGALGANSYRVGNAITVGAMGAASFANTFTLTGNVTMDAVALGSGVEVALTGSWLSDGDGAPYTLTVTGAPLRFGGADKFAVLDVTFADESGVTLADRIWLTRPLAGDYTSAASVVFAGPGAEPLSGNQTLDGTNVCLTASNALGTGSETVAISNNGSLILLATSGDSLPTYDTGYTMTAAYAVTLDSTSTLQLGGYGTVAFSGSVTGGGTLRVTGAADLTGADLTGFTGAIVLDGGAILVDEGATQTFAQRVSGGLEKRGGGELVLAGTEAGDVNLTVTEGAVRLAAVAPEVTNVVIGVAGKLVLDGSNGDQIADKGIVQINGIFDLNGRSETVFLYYNRSPADLSGAPMATARIVNSSSGEATLSASSRSPFAGKVTETAGKITLRQTGDYLIPFGTPGAIAPSKVMMAGSSILLPYTQYATFVFVFKRARTNGSNISLAEIELTHNGIPLIPSWYASASASSQYADAQAPGRIIDGLANTTWRSDVNTTNATLTIAVNGQQKVDGYRFCTGYDRNMDPADWDVWVTRSDNLWHLVDVRRNFVLPAQNDWRNNSTDNFAFNQDYPQNAFAATTAVELATNAVFRVSGTEPTAFGTLTGSGLVQLERGSFFAAADLAGFAGRFVTSIDSGREAKVLLDGETGAAEQPVRATSATAAFLAVESAKTNAVSLLVDDTYPEGGIAYGRLGDGAGRLGFVKRGTGARSVAYSSAENTGDTRIEEGTLTVCGKRQAVHARYIRFTPSAYSGKDGNGFFYGMNEFILLSSGNKVAWPSGTSIANSNGKGFHTTSFAANLIDGNTGTRCLVATDKSVLEYPSLTFDTVSGVTFDNYEWYVPYGNPADAARVPTAWTLSVSNDGETWTTIDSETYSYNKVYSLQLVGPYSLGGNVALSAGATIPSAFFAGTTDRSTRAPALKARYLKFDPYETRNTPGAFWAYTGYQLTEFQLYRDGRVLQWGSSATASAALGPYTGYPYSLIVDNVLASTDNSNRGFSTILPNPIIIDAGEEVTFDAYGYVTAPNTAERDPVSWNLYVSTTGTNNWVLIDNQNALSGVLTTDRNAAVGPWSVSGKFHDYDTATSDALTDFAPLFLAGGATLRLQTGYEAFGPLGGTGTLALDNAIADVNGFAGAAFAGPIVGEGTFCKSGIATQAVSGACSFVGGLQVNGGVLDVSGASFAGVDTLALTGGVFRATSATFGGGNLTVDFNGGAYDATCDNVGELVVKGDVLLDIPEAPVLPYIKPLFTFSRIDGGSVAALKAAVLTRAVPKSVGVYVQVTESSATLVLSRSGTLSVLR